MKKSKPLARITRTTMAGLTDFAKTADKATLYPSVGALGGVTAGLLFETGIGIPTVSLFASLGLMAYGMKKNLFGLKPNEEALPYADAANIAVPFSLAWLASAGIRKLLEKKT